jgi:hypothetical protein
VHMAAGGARGKALSRAMPVPIVLLTVLLIAQATTAQAAPLRARLHLANCMRRAAALPRFSPCIAQIGSVHQFAHQLSHARAEAGGPIVTRTRRQCSGIAPGS